MIEYKFVKQPTLHFVYEDYDEEERIYYGYYWYYSREDDTHARELEKTQDPKDNLIIYYDKIHNKPFDESLIKKPYIGTGIYKYAMRLAHPKLVALMNNADALSIFNVSDEIWFRELDKIKVRRNETSKSTTINSFQEETLLELERLLEEKLNKQGEK